MKKLSTRIRVICMECGRRFSVSCPSICPRCPNCRGCDIDIDPNYYHMTVR